MSVKVKGVIKKYEEVEIDQEQAIFAIEFFIKEKVPSLKYIDELKDGKKYEIDDVDFHTGNYSYKEIGNATEQEIKAYELINDIRKLLHSK